MKGKFVAKVPRDTRPTPTFSIRGASRRTHILTASLLRIVPLAAGCGRAYAQTADTDAAPPSAVIGVAANCPADAGPMRPGSAGAMADLNGDGYVCTLHFRSIDGDTLRVTVDNDVPTPDNARVEHPYIFNG